MNTCSTCRYWRPEERREAGSLIIRSQEPYCTQILVKGKPKVVYAESQGCWLWKETEGELKCV